jgi:anti-sigma factor RsiW
MVDRASPHIADDPDRLEEFVLGRLDAAGREAVENHVASCDRCAKAVRNERALAAGARSLGRSIVKENLQRRLALRAAPSRTPWPRILSVAAVLCILAGVGWLNHWFLGTEPRSEMVTDKLSGAKSPGAEQPMPRPTEQPTAPSTRRADRDEEGKITAAPRPPEYAAKADRPAGETDARVRSAEESRPVVKNEMADLAADGGRQKVGISQDVKIDMEKAGPEESFWVEGKAIAEAPTMVTGMAAGKDASQLKKKSVAQAPLAEKETRSLQAAGSVAAQSNMNFRVLQRTSGALPGSRQNLQQRNAPPSGVQTHFENKQGETVMTLYLDSLVDRRDLRNATVDRVADDSLIVNIGNQKIGYRLPAKNQLQQHPVK